VAVDWHELMGLQPSITSVHVHSVNQSINQSVNLWLKWRCHCYDHYGCYS